MIPYLLPNDMRKRLLSMIVLSLRALGFTSGVALLTMPSKNMERRSPILILCL